MSESERCFVDSNIWLFAFIAGQDTSKSQIAQNLLRDKQDDIIISSQVVNEVCVNLIRKAGMEETAVQQLTHSFYRQYDVLGLTEPLLLTASDLRQHYSLSYWDSLIVAAALSAGATTLYSEDMQNGHTIENTLVITNPFHL